MEIIDDLRGKDCDLNVSHVKAHRTEKEKKAMTIGGRFVMDGNEKAHEWAKDGAEVDGGAMAPSSG